MIRRPLINSVILAALLAAPGFAQEQDTTTAQEADTTAAGIVTLAPLVVTVSRIPLRADRIGFAVSLVGSQQLALEKPLYAADPLRNLPGAYIDEAAGPGGPTIVRLRGGEEVFTQILMDGVQVNQNGGFFDFQGLTLGNVERIEVARGPQSALYGSSAVSGVVHFITRRGELGPPRLELMAEGGGASVNGGSFSATGSAAGGAGWLGYSVGLGATYSRGIYDIAHDIRTGDVSVRLDATPSDRWDLRGIFRAISVEADLPIRDPGATRVPLDPNARNERDRIISSLSARYSPSRHWTHALTTSLYRERFVFEDFRDDVAADEMFDFFIFDADFTLDSELLRPMVEYVGSYEFRPDQADGSLTLSFGGEWQREELMDRTAGEFGEGSLELDRNSVAGFLEAQTDLIPRVSLLVGSRIEKFEDLSAESTPRASALVNILPGALSVRAAAGRAYIAPNLQQQFLDNPFIASNPDLEAETSTSWEFGVDATLAGGDFAAGVTYFHQDFDNLIRSVSQENSSQQINKNLGEARAEGIEWAAKYRASRWWLVGTDGAWVETKILDNTGLSEDEFPVGESLPFRPTVVGSVFVEILPIGGLTGIARGSFVGTQTVLTERFGGQRTDLDSYFLVGLKANYAVSPQFELYTRIDNLFDTDYETAFDRHGIPFTAAAGVRLSTR